MSSAKNVGFSGFSSSPFGLCRRSAGCLPPAPEGGHSGHVWETHHPSVEREVSNDGTGGAAVAWFPLLSALATLIPTPCFVKWKEVITTRGLERLLFGGIASLVMLFYIPWMASITLKEYGLGIFIIHVSISYRELRVPG